MKTAKQALAAAFLALFCLAALAQAPQPPRSRRAPSW
jgi:hypothetical protein